MAKLELLSRTIYDADGVQTNWDFNFASGYLLPEHVKAYYELASVRTQVTVTPAMLIGPNQLRIVPAVPAGAVLTIYRDTPKNAPLVDFVDRGTVSEVALDTIAKQAVFVAAEAGDSAATAATDVAVNAAASAQSAALSSSVNAASAAASALAAAASASGAASTASAAINAHKAELAAPAGSNLSGHLPTGTGAVATTVGAQLKRMMVFPENYGAVGDGSADDTLAWQRAIDAAPDGCEIWGTPGAIYKVRKNAALSAAIYPVRGGNTAGEQPCLLISNRKRLTLVGNGATLKVTTHAQGILDILQSSDIEVFGFKFEGPGNFPSLDGTTGRGEKGTATQGYYDSGAVANGPARNNARNTSTFTTGGYGGAFPQLGGGTASTWGAWTDGGYIANTGNALFIADGSSNVAVHNNEIFGFNGDGVQVNSGLAESYGWAAPSQIRVYQNKIYGNYNAGIEYHAVNGLFIWGNHLYNNGHPNASVAHTHIDPGYGIGSNNGTAPLNINIQGNHCTGNKRKGIDAHSMGSAVITENIVSDSGYGIMLVNGSLGSISNIVVSNNLVSRIAYPVSAQGTGIYIERNADGLGFAGNVAVNGNVISEVGVPPGMAAIFPGVNPVGIGMQLSGTLSGLTCVGNVVQNTTYVGGYGLIAGWAGADAITGTIVGNEVRGGFVYGLNNSASGSANSLTAANNVELTSVAPYASAQVGLTGATDRMIALNNVTVPTGQMKVLGTSLGIQIVINITLASGVLTWTAGHNAAKYITSVATDPLGVKVVLNGVNPLVATFSQASASRAITGASTPLDHIYCDYESGVAYLGFRFNNVSQNGNNCTGVFRLVITI